MALPKSIEERGARADEMMQRVAGTPPTAAPPQPQQQQQEQAPPKVEPAPVPTPAFEASWEQRFKVLQGKYNAEVPGLHGQVRQLTTELQAVKAEAETLKARPASSIDLSAISAEEREQYGEDFVNFVAKVAKGQTPAAQAVDLTQVNQRVDHLANVVAETREDEFFRKLDAAADGWSALNTDAGFLAWLAETDVLSGLTRQQMFNDAYAKLDVDRVAKFFKSFGGTAQSSEFGASQATPLNEQVVPQVNRSATPPPAGKKMWQARDIAMFYADVRTGRFKGREAEMAQVEADIFAAQREGRVR